MRRLSAEACRDDMAGTRQRGAAIDDSPLKEVSYDHSFRGCPHEPDRALPRPSGLGLCAMADYRARLAIRHIEQHLRHSIDWPALARSLRLSASGLRAIFRRETGLSPAQYQKQRRLEVARGLLCTKLMTVKEVADAVGIGDTSHFVRDFAKKFGLSPTRYRQKHFHVDKPAS
jgi:AraC-like DNA-binding protein